MAKAPAKTAKKRKKRNRFKIVVVLFCIIIAVSLALAGAIVYVRHQNAPIQNEKLSRFAIREITISGNTKYDEAAILGESGLKVGQSIFSVNKGAAAKKLKETFPYIQDAVVKNVTYNTLCIEITETKVVGAMYGKENWLVVGQNGKVLEILPLESDRPGRYFYLQGTTPAEEIAIGLPAMDERSTRIANTVFTALEENEVEGVLGIDMRDKTNISLNYQNTMTILLGSERNIAFEIRLFKQALPQIAERNGGAIAGRLDLSSYSDDTDKNDQIVYTPADVLENE